MPKRIVLRIIKAINAINTSLGLWLCGGVITVMSIAVAYEVVMRYFFNMPTKWSMELNLNLFCVCALMAGGYTLVQDGHVRVDVFYIRLSLRKKAILDLITCWFLFLFCGILIWQGWDMAYAAFQSGETSTEAMGWVLWPSQMMVPIGAFLLGIQGLIKFGCDIGTVIKNREVSLWKTPRPG